MHNKYNILINSFELRQT